MKHEWKKLEKELYLPKTKPSIITIPQYSYIAIKGIGNPNSEDFEQRIKTLYGLSYTVRMMHKKGVQPDDFYEYVVYPLEGIWTSSQTGDTIETEGLNKDKLEYTLMIRQPSFMTREIFDYALTQKDVPAHHLEVLDLVEIPSHRYVHMMHKGTYDDEVNSFAQMKDFINDENLTRINEAYHTEVYITMSRTDSSKNKTVLRYEIA